MTKINLVVAVDELGGMGLHNKLLCHLPDDLKHFKSLTIGKPIIMGRKTFDSIGKALPGRVNIVLSRKLTDIEGVLVVNDLSTALKLTKELPDVMVIGGAQVFADALPLAHRIYLTRIHHQFFADVFFPPLDEKIWSCTDSTYRAADDKNQYAMTFCCYERR